MHTAWDLVLNHGHNLDNLRRFPVSRLQISREETLTVWTVIRGAQRSENQN